MKTKTKILLLAMSKAEREKRLDELNQKLGITQSQEFIESDLEEIEEREWLKKKLGYGQR
jgi:predicted DNA-binding protein